MPIDVAQIELFALVFIRLTAAFSVLPVFSNAAIPSMLKAGLAGIMALLVVPAMDPTMLAAHGTALDFFNLALRESLCGILIGFVGQMLFYAVEVAGNLIGYQIGFSFVSSVDPNSDAQSTVMTQLYTIFATLLFLCLNGHHLMIGAVAESLQRIPVGSFVIGDGFMTFFIASAATILADGVRLAAPIMVTLLVTDIGFGILTRVAPAMNVFVIGFPLKIAGGLLMTAASLQIVAMTFGGQLQSWTRQTPVLLRLMGAP
ncbi:flagellar biosynthetic protein FliR [candidate division KSB1 bacterium]|nr:flagellar biosynthetic protein FliR [candidate division KSB1 bacterium]